MSFSGKNSGQHTYGHDCIYHRYTYSSTIYPTVYIFTYIPIIYLLAYHLPYLPTVYPSTNYSTYLPFTSLPTYLSSTYHLPYSQLRQVHFLSSSYLLTYLPTQPSVSLKYRFILQVLCEETRSFSFLFLHRLHFLQM